MKKNEINQKEIIIRSRFIHGLFCNPKYTIFNWTFTTSCIITIVVILFNLKVPSRNNAAFLFLKSHRFDFFSVSISAIGIILSAIAIVIVIFDKKQLHKIINAKNKAFEGFIFPYRYSASIWGILGLISLLSGMLNININSCIFSILNYIWLFMLLYAFLYPLYLIGEIIQFILFSAYANKK